MVAPKHRKVALKRGLDATVFRGVVGGARLLVARRTSRRASIGDDERIVVRPHGFPEPVEVRACRRAARAARRRARPRPSSSTSDGSRTARGSSCSCAARRGLPGVHVALVGPDGGHGVTARARVAARPPGDRRPRPPRRRAAARRAPGGLRGRRRVRPAVGLRELRARRGGGGGRGSAAIVLTDRCGVAELFAERGALVVPYDESALREALQRVLQRRRPATAPRRGGARRRGRVVVAARRRAAGADLPAGARRRDGPRRDRAGPGFRRRRPRADRGAARAPRRSSAASRSSTSCATGGCPRRDAQGRSAAAASQLVPGFDAANVARVRGHDRASRARRAGASSSARPSRRTATRAVLARRPFGCWVAHLARRRMARATAGARPRADASRSRPARRYCARASGRRCAARACSGRSRPPSRHARRARGAASPRSAIRVVPIPVDTDAVLAAATTPSGCASSSDRSSSSSAARTTRARTCRSCSTRSRGCARGCRTLRLTLVGAPPSRPAAGRASTWPATCRRSSEPLRRATLLRPAVAAGGLRPRRRRGARLRACPRS